MQTFWWAYQRSKKAHGVLIMRNEDLDQSRAKPEFVKAFLEDLRLVLKRFDECIVLNADVLECRIILHSVGLALNGPRDPMLAVPMPLTRNRSAWSSTVRPLRSSDKEASSFHAPALEG